MQSRGHTQTTEMDLLSPICVSRRPEGRLDDRRLSSSSPQQPQHTQQHVHVIRHHPATPPQQPYVGLTPKTLPITCTPLQTPAQNPIESDPENCKPHHPSAVRATPAQQPYVEHNPEKSPHYMHPPATPAPNPIESDPVNCKPHHSHETPPPR